MRTKVMGIVNVTPDSFSDGGKFFRPDEAIRRAKNMVEEGADIIDLGAESTRPDATPITWQSEWSRLEPILNPLPTTHYPLPTTLSPLPSTLYPLPSTLSIDTYHPETAERALAAGATMINCVHAASIPAIAECCAKHHAEIVVPWRIGWKESDHGYSPDSLRQHGLAFYLDPMIGFDTDREQDLALLKSIPDLAKLGRVLVGASRKRIVKKLTGEKVSGKNLGGNLGIAVWCAMNGASAVRVHDVAETVQALRVIDALKS